MNAEIYDIVGLVRDITIVLSLVLITVTVCVVGIKAYGVIKGFGEIAKRAANFFDELQNIQEGGNIVKVLGRSVMFLGKLFKGLS